MTDSEIADKLKFILSAKNVEPDVLAARIVGVLVPMIEARLLGDMLAWVTEQKATRARARHASIYPTVPQAIEDYARERGITGMED